MLIYNFRIRIKYVKWQQPNPVLHFTIGLLIYRKKPILYIARGWLGFICILSQNISNTSTEIEAWMQVIKWQSINFSSVNEKQNLRMLESCLIYQKGTTTNTRFGTSENQLNVYSQRFPSGFSFIIRISSSPVVHNTLRHILWWKCKTFLEGYRN